MKLDLRRRHFGDSRLLLSSPTRPLRDGYGVLSVQTAQTGSGFPLMGTMVVTFLPVLPSISQPLVNPSGRKGN
jgi:hypothetical protein